MCITDGEVESHMKQGATLDVLMTMGLTAVSEVFHFAEQNCAKNMRNGVNSVVTFQI